MPSSASMVTRHRGGLRTHMRAGKHTQQLVIIAVTAEAEGALPAAAQVFPAVAAAL